MYNPDIHHRQSIRLRDFDYSQPGSYFVTIVTQDRNELFGEIIDGEMRLNNAGKMAERVWTDLPNRFAIIALDCYVVMPNHIHVLFQITNQPGQPRGRAPTDAQPSETTMGDIVGAYKSLTTDEYIHGVRDKNWSSFPGRLWQRNYYEHVVRDDDEMDRIRTYIADNPRHWENGDMNFEPVV